MSGHDLTDFEWSVIEPLLPQKSRGVPRVDDRRVLNGIFWRFRTGSPWADIPERYGPHTTCYNRFVRWSYAGIWDRLLAAMTEACDGDIVMIDSSHVRVHQHGAAPVCSRSAAKIRHGKPDLRSFAPVGGTAPKKKKAGDANDSAMGRSRGGLTTKIHAVVDAEGRPIKLALSPGQDHDSTQALPLLGDLCKGTILLADKAYDSDAIRAFADDRGAWANIPPKSNRKDGFACSQWLYRQRNLVERFFNKLKQFRGIATRYDRKAENFLAAIKLVAVRLWLRFNEAAAWARMGLAATLLALTGRCSTN